MTARQDAPRGRLPIALWLLLLAATGGAGAQGTEAPGRGTALPVTVEELTFEPPRFYVGDRVTARVVVRSSRQLTAPASVAADEWVVVHGVDTVPRSDGHWEVRVGFSSYRPGVLTLPPIDVGAFRLENIRVQAASLLSGERAAAPVLRPPRPQLLLPATGGVLLGAAAAVLTVPYLLVSGVLLLAGRARRRRRRRARGLPRVQLERAVRRLQASSPRSMAAVAETVSFYAQLAHLTRDYLAARTRIPAHACTTGELRAALSGHALPEHGLRGTPGTELAAILDTADRVKFAGRHSSAAEMQNLSEQLIGLVQAIDAALEGVEEDALVER